MTGSRHPTQWMRRAATTRSSAPWRAHWRNPIIPWAIPSRLADAAAIPYINRANMLGLAGLWENRRLHVTDWYARIRQRPSFNSAVTAYWDDDARQRFDVPRDEVWVECTNILPA